MHRGAPILNPCRVRAVASMGATVVGMTNLPEAKLAREAEMSYATVAMATDYDCWRPHTEEVQATSVMAVLQENVENAPGVGPALGRD